MDGLLFRCTSYGKSEFSFDSDGLGKTFRSMGGPMSSYDVLGDRVRVDPHTPVPHLRGVVLIHSCPKPLTSHVEWALASILGPSARLQWLDQPLLAANVRCEHSYRAPVGSAARIASALRAFPGIRYEVTQEQWQAIEGERYSFTPNLGIHRSAIGQHGDVVIGEDRLRAAIARAGDEPALRRALDDLLGGPWDAELEPFRCAGADSGVRWMSTAGTA